MSTIDIHPDQVAADKIRHHHAALVDQLTERVAAVRDAADADYEAARAALVDWLRTELVPHAEGEEHTFYRAAGETVRGKLLVAAVTAEHGVIRGYVEQVEAGTDRHEVNGWAGALLRLFVSHAGLENDLILPLLVEEPGIDLVDLLHQMHEH